jgi:Tfp pilus assembly protein PilZ
VRRCSLDFGEGPPRSAFLVNINTFGAYVASDELPPLGCRVICQFGMPDTERELTAQGIVVWVNPRQQHPVHSLPPGFGVRFDQLSNDALDQIERVIVEYLSSRPR